MKQTLIVMVKEPRPGKVKTRLGRDIGMTASAWWFRHQTRQLLRRLRDPRWHIVLAVTPDAEGMRSRVWPQGLPRWPQGRGNLGDRMARMMGQVQVGCTCVIGSDIPGITASHVAQAFRALGNHDAVVGPAPDGGFWLIGLKFPRRQPPSLFNDVRWSSAQAWVDTKATLPGYHIAEVATLSDVDDIGDLP